MLATLVRSKLKERYPSDTARFRPVNGVVGHHLALVNKLHEITSEIARNPSDSMNYADLLQALMDLAELQHVSWDEVRELIEIKARQFGTYHPGVVLTEDEDEHEKRRAERPR